MYIHTCSINLHKCINKFKHIYSHVHTQSHDSYNPKRTTHMYLFKTHARIHENTGTYINKQIQAYTQTQIEMRMNTDTRWENLDWCEALRIVAQNASFRCCCWHQRTPTCCDTL